LNLIIALIHHALSSVRSIVTSYHVCYVRCAAALAKNAKFTAIAEFTLYRPPLFIIYDLWQRFWSRMRDGWVTCDQGTASPIWNPNQNIYQIFVVNLEARNM